MLEITIYFVLAVGISAVCSVSEAGLLSLTRGDVAKLVESGKRSGKVLEVMKANVNRPLAAILTLNTIANCYGAAGVGAEAENLWGVDGMAYASGTLTLCILVFSEILPKSVGARFAVKLADFTAPVITLMTYLTYPFVVVLQAISRLVGGDEADKMSREDISMAVQIGKDDGVIDQQEAEAIKKFIELNKLTVKEIMTPIAQASTLLADRTVEQTISDQPDLPFSRLPVRNAEGITHVVRRDEVYAHHATGKKHVRIGDIARPIPRVNAVQSLREALLALQAAGVRLLLVEDDDRQPIGIMTSRDILMSLFGRHVKDTY